MAVTVGDSLPDVELFTMGKDGIRRVSTKDMLGSGKVVLFGLPGAFTPTCSDHHLPGFVARAADIRAKGVDRIACVSVNDPFVMDAWGKAQGVGNDVLMLADSEAEFTRAMGLETRSTGFGLGERSKRYACMIEDGVVTSLFVEPGPGLEVSSAEAVLAVL